MAIIGIDLGTTNSLVSVFRNGHVEIIRDVTGEEMIPSAVAVDDEKKILIGKAAKERNILHPEQSAVEFKRRMGSVDKISLGDSIYTPEELSAFILKKCKEEAENYLGEPVTEAIISVPAYFDNNKREATKMAAAIAGLNCQRILNEPSAAALAYRLESEETDEQYVMVIDFGGGTLDVSLVDCFENIVEIAGVSGNNRLGGKNFDEKIAKAFLEENEIDKDGITDSDYALVKRMAEESKIMLSQKENVIMKCKLGDRFYSMELNDEKLIKICGNLLLQMKEVMVRVIKDANCSVNEITDVILVGGTCKLKIVQKYISELFHRDFVCGEDTQTLVAKGIGYYVGIKEQAAGIKDILMTDVCPFSLGTGIKGPGDNQDDIMSVIIKKNSTLPKSCKAQYVPVSVYQNKIKFTIYQGENYYVKDNIKLGEFEIDIKPDITGNQVVEVTMAYDMNGILYVEAKNSDGKRVNYCFSGEKGNLSKAEIEQRAKKIMDMQYLPRELEECTTLIETALHLYEQADDYNKVFLARCIDSLYYARQCVSQINGIKIVRHYKELLEQYMDFVKLDPFAMPKVEDMEYEEEFDEEFDEEFFE